MATVYPGTIDTFVNPAGTSSVVTVDHAGLHTNANDAIKAIEQTIGTTTGTSIFRNAVVGDFALTANAGGTLQQAITAGVFNHGTLGTISIIGGTINTATFNGVPTGTSLDSIMPWTINLPVANQGGFDATGGTWIWNVSATSILGGWIAVSSPANTDFIQYQVALAAGTWQLTLGYKKFSSAGIAHVQIDGSDVGTVDMYAGSPSENQWTQVSSITISTSGKHALKILMSTKNASSSNFQAQISSLQLNRTA